MAIGMKEIVGEISVKTVLVALLFIGSAFLFGYLAKEVVHGDKNAFDEKIFAFFKPYTTDDVVDVMKGFTFFGSTYFFIPAYIALITFLFIIRQRTDAINIFIIAITSTLLMLGFKDIFRRERPELPLLKELTNFSFPSGHALCSFIFCSVLIYLAGKSRLPEYWKWVISTLLVLIAIIIGISRIILRYHYATDVIAGFALGFVWVTLSIWVERKITSKARARELNA